MLHIVCWLGIGGCILSTLLFLVRVNSVFFDSRQAQMMFTIVWATMSASLLVVPFSFSAATSDMDGLCIISSVNMLSTIPSFTVACFDISVFVAVVTCNG